MGDFGDVIWKCKDGFTKLECACGRQSVAEEEYEYQCCRKRLKQIKDNGLFENVEVTYWLKPVNCELANFKFNLYMYLLFNKQ